MKAMLSQWIKGTLLAWIIMFFAPCIGAADRSPGKLLISPLQIVTPGKTGFTEMPAAETGIAFSNLLTRTEAALNQILMNGSGVAAGDVDGDGLCDLYFCRLRGTNVLYRNLGNWKFQDITASCPVIACPSQYSTGALFADIDGDGDLDLLVNSVGGGTRCFVNNGRGSFKEIMDAGLIRKFGSTSMAMADIDLDGDLDLFVANYRTNTIRSVGFEMLNVDGKRMLRPEDRERLYISKEGFVREYGEPSILYINDGKGRFQPLSWTEGRFLDEQGKSLTEPPRDWTLSAMFRDINQDGAPDLYMCNDFWTPDRLWINDGHGVFRAIKREALPNTSTFSMCVDFADINRDGYDDFFVLDMYSPDHVRRITQTIMFGLSPWPLGYSAERPQVTRNTLFLNRGDGTFAEIAQLSKMEATDWSWCPIFLDVDLDGYEDLLIATGNSFDTQDQDAEERIKAMGPVPRSKIPYKLWMYPPLWLPKAAYRNMGNMTFEEKGREWGFKSVGVAQGMCLADLDNDGDLDVVVNHFNSAVGLFRNDTDKPRIAIRLDSKLNTRGIGAKIIVKVPNLPVQTQEMICGGRYLSGDDSIRVFAAGNVNDIVTLEIRWPKGNTLVITNARPNYLYILPEDSNRAPASPTPAMKTPLFADVSSALGYRHSQAVFDDFARQPLLPYKLSQPGPGVSWFDLDNDGWEDLLIAGGRSQGITLYKNRKGAGFDILDPVEPSVLNGLPATAILGYHPKLNSSTIWIGLSNYEDNISTAASAVSWDYGTRKVLTKLPGIPSSSGALAMADIDGDGDLDLLITGRVVPGRFPEPATSRILLNQSGVFELDAVNNKLLANVGMVNSGIFSDLTGDGWPDLLLACCWGPLRLFRNEKGRLVDESHKLASWSGWWNGVATVDLDNDGHLDIVASNWGRNTRYEDHRTQALQMYYGDFNEAGSVDIVEAYYDKAMDKLVPERALVSMAAGLPFIRERFTTHKAYGQASISEILGERISRAHILSANTLESMVFLNRSNRFEARILPIEAQFAPAFAVVCGDFDADGNQDVF